jgi:hypothetical protein
MGLFQMAKSLADIGRFFIDPLAEKYYYSSPYDLARIGLWPTLNLKDLKAGMLLMGMLLVLVL